MTEITGKTIYVLGAGASVHTGAPLLNDFLVKARMLLESKTTLKHKESFERVFEWIDRLRGSSYYIDFDLDNLEHIFSLAEMQRQLAIAGGEMICKDLKYLIMETLDQCKLEYRDKRINPDRTYSAFLEILANINEKRQKITQQPQGTFEKDVIITFNYDIMLDNAFNSNRYDIDYGLPNNKFQGREPFKVFKLHGSLNWASCSSCGNKIQVVNASPIPEGHRIDPFIDDSQLFPFKMFTKVLPEIKCTECEKTGVLAPFIIPPTWSKAVEGEPIAPVWAKAIKEIKNAFQIIVIGYSLPPTDTFFQYLLTLGLAENRNLHRIIVVNKDNSEEMKLRYEKVFSRSLKDRNRLMFLSGVNMSGRIFSGTFEDFVGIMGEYGSEI